MAEKYDLKTMLEEIAEDEKKPLKKGVLTQNEIKKMLLEKKKGARKGG